MKSDQLSQTAAFVAIKFFGLTQIDSYRSIFENSVLQFYEDLVQSLPAPLRFYRYWLTFGWVRKLYILIEEGFLPGDLLHVVARKWYIQKLTEQLIKQGYEQLVVLGAGFDHLAFYYANKGLDCYEFDAPRMAGLKRDFLAKAYPRQEHPKIIDSYLPSDKLRDLLPKHVDPHKKTAVIAEGFFDYLDANTVTTSLAALRNFFSHNPALISTHFALDELSPFHRKVFASSVLMVGEKLQFNTSMNDFSQLLAQEGFDISQIYDAQTIETECRKILKTTLPVLKGFYVFMAHADGNDIQKSS